MPFIRIEFNREENTHTLEINKCNGGELLIAYQAIKNNIEEELNMPVEVALQIAFEENENDKE